MFNYTDALTALMRDIITRVDALGGIDLSRVLLFARFGRSSADGPYATCHSLNLPASEPGYYFWRDRSTGELTKRSEWFVTKSPTVTVRGTRIDYLVSFALPRFCDQTLEGARKAERYPGAPPWVAKLDTIVHELHHIDPREPGIRRVARTEGGEPVHSHGAAFFDEVTAFVQQYLASAPDPAIHAFLQDDFVTLQRRCGPIVATTFRQFPSYPQRYHEPLAHQPDTPRAVVVPLATRQRRHVFTEADLELRVFTPHGTRRVRPGS